MEKLKLKSNKIRKDIINLAMKYSDGHVASAMSTVEIMVALYYKIMNENDQFILSKGHGCLALYSILNDIGFNPTYCGHPDIDEKNGIVCTSGSLGHGLPIGVGKALAKKIKNEDGIIYVLVGDGESQEGTIWESFNLINRYKLNNIVPIIDHNKIQALDTVENIMNETNLKAKIQAFGLKVLEINGHDLEEVVQKFTIYSSQYKKDNLNNKPLVIIANTIKGKGISFMEGNPIWQSRLMNEEELKKALLELQTVNCEL